MRFLSSKCWIFLFVGSLLWSCSKDNDSGNGDDADKIVVIDGQAYSQVSTINITKGTDEQNWTSNSGGALYVDSTSNIGDSITLFMTATEGCFSAEQRSGTPMITQQESVLQFSYMLPETSFNDIREGNGFTCAGACRMEIFQGEELLLSEWIRESDEWAELQFFFRTKQTEEVKIRLVVGSKKGLWIDNLNLLQKL